MNAMTKPTYEHLITTIDRRDQWGQRWTAWQAQLMHRYARRISARHKNPQFSLENVK